MAEVILNIDNSARRLPISFTEVEIGRRIYRDGESEFLINRARVRLRDLVDLLAGANLADNPFTFIGQGLVDEVLALRPQDRRTVIEEAAGTRRLQQRRVEALERLKHAQAELVRVNDILGEIGPRVELLTEQAAKWTEYEGIRAELRRRALRWYRSSFGDTARTRADLVARLQSVERELERFADQIAETETLAAGSEEDLLAAREEEERRRIGLADARAAEAIVRERIAALKASLDAVGAEGERTRSALAALPAELASLRARRLKLDEEAASAARHARDAADAARIAEEEASRTRVALAEAQAARVETLLHGQAAALRVAIERAERELAEREGAIAPPALPTGLRWLHERIRIDDSLVVAVRAALGETVAVAPTRSAVVGLRTPGLAVVVPDDVVEIRTPAGCERLADTLGIDPDVRPIVDAALHNVFLAPDRRTALAAARGLAGGVVVTSDGFAVRPGLVRLPATTAADAERQARERLRAVLTRLREDLEERHAAGPPERVAAPGVDPVAASEAAERGAFSAHAAATKAAEDARLEAATSEERRASLVRLRDALDEQVAATERRLADEEGRLRALEGQAGDARERLSASHAELVRAEADAREAQRSADLSRERALAAEGSRRESEQRLARARERIAELRGERSKLVVEEERASGAMQILEEQVRAELGLPEDEPLPDPGTLASDEGEPDEKERATALRDLQRLRRRLIALEPVNPLAATELAEIGQRYSFLSTQRDDLEKAIADLRTLADELATTIAEQFSATLQAVDREFGLFFQRLFNGGQASLRTSDVGEEDAEPGIDIYARPPGKRIGSLTQLSGGERALTAVALLLAILRVKPAPFCVLDEVDAALDERNIGRFTQALRELTDRTQFVVITHNRGTIEAADTLYGVSMDDSGVSKVISMRLADVEERVG